MIVSPSITLHNVLCCQVEVHDYTEMAKQFTHLHAHLHVVTSLNLATLDIMYAHNYSYNNT